MRLTLFAPEIWTAEGPVVHFSFFCYPTRMAIIRLADGGLFIWSPVALDGTLKVEIDMLGPVRHLVAPNALHHLYLTAWQRAYPSARLYAPPGLKNKRKDIAFDAVLADGPMPWRDEIDQLRFGGSFALSEMVFFHRASKTALFADLIQNFAEDWFTGWRGVVARLGGIVMPNQGTPRDWRLSFLNRGLARAARDRILAWHPERVIIAHGRMAHRDGEAFIARGLSWL